MLIMQSAIAPVGKLLNGHGEEAGRLSGGREGVTNARPPAYNASVPLEGFHPTIRRWFAERFGEPTEPQREGWPRIRAGQHTLISAPTGMGKTLAAYLAAIDELAPQGKALADQTHVLYVSPLRALSNDVQKNLQGPLKELAELDAELPKIRVLVRTGDTPQTERAAMLRKPPHILVTTPESL